MPARFAPWLAAAAVACLTVPAARAADGDPAGRKVALLVGVSDYLASAELRALPGAANDARRLREVLVHGGFRPDDVTLLTTGSGGGPKPTAANVQAAIASALGKCRPEDTVVVAFAGHGLQFAGSAEQYFCPHDAVWNKPDTLVPLSRVYETLAQCPARRKVLLVDACRNDPLAESDRRDQNVRALAKGFAPAAQAGDFVALFSCKAGQTAMEDRRLNHGVFFHHVILGLAGQAAGKDGSVSLLGLASFVTRGVTEYVKEHFDAEQVPMFRAPGEAGDFPLVVPAAVTAVQQLLRDATLAEARGDHAAAIAACDQALGLDKKNAEAYFRRGTLKVKAKAYEAAAQDFDRALKYKPDHVAAHLARAEANFWLDDNRAALRDYTMALEEDPEHAEALKDRGYMYMALKEYDKAVADLDRAIELDPGSAQAYHFRGVVRLHQGRVAEATADLDKAVALDPHNVKVREQRLSLAIQSNDDARVRQETARQEQLAAHLPQTDYATQERLQNQSVQAGQYYRATGRYEDAGKAFDRAATQAERMYDRANSPAAARQERVAEMAAREVERMTAAKARAVDSWLNQLEAAHNAGNTARANALAGQLRATLPPNLRKEFDAEWKQAQQDARWDRPPPERNVNNGRQAERNVNPPPTRGGNTNPPPAKGGRAGGKGKG